MTPYYKFEVFDMNVIAERLKEAMKLRNLKQVDLVQRTGIGKSSICTYLAGEYLPKQTNLYKLAKALSVDPAWLMGEDVPMEWKDEPSPASRPLPAGLLPVVKRRIPIIGHVAAGVPIMAEREYEEYEDDTYGLSCDYVLRVEGDSMEPRVLDGDVVYVRQQPDVDDGQIAVVGVDDSVTLKVVYHLPNGLQLVSLNPKYKPMIYTQANTDYLAIIGLAVAYKRRL